MSLIAEFISKKPWVPPEIICILPEQTLNRLGTGADNDGAMAES